LTIPNQIELDVRSLITQDFKNFFTGQRILITGASGLMGSYFTTLFQEFNINFGGKSQLYVVSKSDRYPISIHTSTSRLKMDLSEELNLDHLPKFDSIIHCAGYAQPLILFQSIPPQFCRS
jgi:FlaA1/EpsC-like NDP-sugar epimerase